ncbi:hypothetical protein CRG98_012840 [Punica granatum]|uniref:Uncharacterized protein n=1 Tax=Punica granatum TaxID=22663 RepID=A0A2I0KE90_PUNGR|nr:hypothetical protein CRG98_012840 [Punica granatum]
MIQLEDPSHGLEEESQDDMVGHEGELWDKHVLARASTRARAKRIQQAMQRLLLHVHGGEVELLGELHSADQYSISLKPSLDDSEFNLILLLLGLAAARVPDCQAASLSSNADFFAHSSIGFIFLQLAHSHGPLAPKLPQLQLSLPLLALTVSLAETHSSFFFLLRPRLVFTDRGRELDLTPETRSSTFHPRPAAPVLPLAPCPTPRRPKTVQAALSDLPGSGGTAPPPGSHPFSSVSLSALTGSIHFFIRVEQVTRNRHAPAQPVSSSPAQSSSREPVRPTTRGPVKPNSGPSAHSAQHQIPGAPLGPAQPFKIRPSPTKFSFFIFLFTEPPLNFSN